MDYEIIKELKERVATESQFYFNDKGAWRITLGEWRTNEFLNLLQKIHDKEFDRLTLGERWLVADLLDSIHDMGVIND